NTHHIHALTALLLEREGAHGSFLLAPNAPSEWLSMSDAVGVFHLGIRVTAQEFNTYHVGFRKAHVNENRFVVLVSDFQIDFAVDHRGVEPERRVPARTTVASAIYYF